MFPATDNNGLDQAVLLSATLLEGARTMERDQTLTADDEIVETSIGTSDSDFENAFGTRAEADFDEDDDAGVYEDEDDVDDDDDFDDDLDDDFDDDDDDDDFDADDDDDFD